MRFDKIIIGEKFVCQLGNTLYAFRKKSLSSAYVLDPDSMKPVCLATFARYDSIGSFLTFSGAADIHPLL